MKARVLQICIASFLLASLTAHAQTATGTIQGTVFDSGGAAVPAADVTLVDLGTGQQRKQQTDESGNYKFPLIRRGNYSLTVEKAGFRKEAVEGIDLQIAEIRSVEVRITPGQVSEQVVVTASAGLLQGSESSLSQVIDEKRVSQLPINGRNMMQLVGLAPGVTIGAKASATERQANYGPSFTLGGQRDNTSVVLVDGIEISGMEQNNYPLAIPSLESVAEFRVVTANASAEFGGNSGAIVNVASKSGTNRLTGSLFHFLRNDAMDARNFFSIEKTPLRRNQFGATVGGPVWIPKLYNGKDRTFWLFSYEGMRQKTAQSNTAVVPEMAIRQGDFSSIPGITIVDATSKMPFANNIIPESRLNPLGVKFANFYPAPNSSDPARNYYAMPSTEIDNDIFATRIDHKISTNNNLFGRFTTNQPKNISPGQGGVFPGYDAIQGDSNLQIALGDTHVFSPTLINEFNAGFVRFRRDRNSADAGTRNWLKELGIQGVDDSNPFTWGAPYLSATGFTGVGYASANSYFHWVSQSFQLVDNLTKIHGKHTFKTGFSFAAKRNSSTQWLTPNGSYTFSGIFSTPTPTAATNRYQALADMLQGASSAYTAHTSPYLPRLQNRLFFAYFQDDWKVTPTLTLNLGLRWEYFGKPEDRYGRTATVDLSTGEQILPAQNGGSSRFVNRDLNNFGPRIGLAWQPAFARRVTVRSAFGMFYTPEIVNSFINLSFQNPFGLQYNRILPPNAGTNPQPYFSIQDPLAGISVTNSNAIRGVDPNFRDGYVTTWNTSVQILAQTNTVVELSYRGSKGTRLSSFLNYNEPIPFPAQPPDFRVNYPYPSLSTLNMLESRGNSTYHAFQARVERRYASGFTFLGSYIFGKALTDIDQSTVGMAGGNGNAFAPQTIRDLQLNKGGAVFNRPHTFIFSTLYDLPFFRNSNTIVGKVIGGWQTGVIGSFMTGHYLTPASFGVTFAGSRASYLGDPNLPRDERSIDRWYDVSQVVNPLPGQLGNAGKGTILGSGTQRLDLVLNKTFSIRETVRVELRGEAFNVLNTPQFDDPQLGPVSNPQAGKITSASDYGYQQTERVLQVALKFRF